MPSGPAIGSIDSSGLKVIAVTHTPLIYKWTSYPSGVSDPAALQVEFDFFSAESSAGAGQQFASLTIEGIALTDLFQAQKFTGRNIVVRAGMQAGLPLANPAQAGVIWNGTIFQSFGNWQGTSQTLDFVMSPGGSIYTYSNPGNFVLNWPKGTSLQSALTTCLNTAYPTLNPPQFAISNQYVLNYNVLHAVSTFPLLAKYVNSITNSIAPPGVFMAINPDNSIHVYDGSVSPSAPKQIAFTDLIGQPTWIDVNTMQFVTVMRADIQVGTVIQMPAGLGGPGTTVLTPNALPSFLGPQYQTSFQGTFLVQSVRFIGNYRDPNGASWATVFKAVPQPGSSTTTNLISGSPNVG